MIFKSSHIVAILVTGALLNLFFINMSDLPPEALRSKGLKEMTPEEDTKLTKVKIKKVKPNKFGLKRMNEERAKKGLAPLPESQEQEIYTDDLGAATSESGGAVGPESIPAQVDNSKLPSFPVVGNQGSQGSCVAWALTYYQMSHQVCLSLGCDNKTAKTRVYSPRWTYNMINGGVDKGSYFSDGFSLQTKHGASLLSALPYNASDYRGWDLNADNWRSAIKSRMSSSQSILINSDTAFANVKQLLTNGHVLVIGTYISSWHFRTVATEPGAASTSPFAGQAIAAYVNGTAGAHAMTVVGFDDSIWTDINGNGLVDDGEKGAFKIANSWGTGWRNAGFAWASYDAFRSTSAVSNFAPSGRRQLTQSGYAYLTTYTPYEPKLLAKVTLSHLARSNISLRFASSSTSSLTPQYYFYPKALVGTGGAYAFNGSNTEVEASFFFDLSSLASSAITDRIYYLLANDTVSGNPLTVKSFEIIDPNVLNTLDAASDVPSFVDGASKTLAIGDVTIDSTAPSAPSNLAASLVSKKKGRKTTVSVSLSWSESTDNVAVMGYRIYRNGVKLAESTNRTYKDDSTSAGKTYIYEVTALDEQGNESAKSNSVSVSR